MKRKDEMLLGSGKIDRSMEKSPGIIIACGHLLNTQLSSAI